VKDGPAAVPSSSRDQAPQCTGGWKFAVEIFPNEWKLPSNSFWIAGWILSDAGGGAADIRAWLGGKLFLGLCGLPRPEIETRALGKAGPPHAGFSFLLPSDPRASDVRLEVCDESGTWQEFYRHVVSPGPQNSAPAKSKIPDDTEISRALLRLLMARRSRPAVPWARLADEALLAAAAVPLDALPNPPFYGRLEFPQSVANVKFGLLEISGWIAHRTERIKRLLAFVGPMSPVALLHRRPRGDVSDVFGELRDGPNSQFAGFIEIPRQLPQPLSLRITAELENGEQHLAFNQRFHPQVTVEASAELPPFSRLTFGRDVAALWAASRRRDLSLGGTQAFRAGARLAFETFQSEAPVAAASASSTSSLTTPVVPRLLEVILVTHNLNREGAPLIALEHAKFLAAQPGWRVRIVSAEAGPLARDFGTAGLPVEVVDVAPIWKTKSNEDFENAVGQLASHCDWKAADLIIANTMVSFWAIHVARRLRKPSILYVHESSSVRRFFASLAVPALFPKIEQAFGEASCVAFSAAASQGAHLRHQRRGNFRVMPGWIDNAAIVAYAAAHSRAELRRAKGIPETAVVFANVGSVCERKGQHVFIRAVALLQSRLRSRAKKELPPLVFLMVGASPGPFVDFLRSEISRQRLDDVHLIEKVAQPYEYFRLADIFVCSSFEESLPRVVMEAAAFGLPVVSSAVNGVPEILAPEDAWLVPPGDAGQLGNAMESALAAFIQGDRTRSERAQRKVCEQFDSATLLPQHVALAAAIAQPPGT
jgi:glycosyltransferase involved in cell wall biosynthesis